MHNIITRPKELALQSSTGLKPLAFEWDSHKKWLIAHVELSNKVAKNKEVEVVLTAN